MANQVLIQGALYLIGLHIHSIHILYECKFKFEYCLTLYRIVGIQLDGKESWLLDHCLANTTMRDYALSMGIQVIMDASMYPDSINTICSFHII